MPSTEGMGVVNTCQHCYISQKQNLVILSSQARCQVNLFSLSQMQTITENHSKSNGEPGLKGYTYIHTIQHPYPRLRDHSGKGGRKGIRASRTGSLLWDHLLGMSEAVPIKISPTCLPKHGLNKDDTINAFVHRVGVGEAQETSTLQKGV